MEKKPEHSAEHWNPGVIFGFGLTVLTASLPGLFPWLPVWTWAIGVVVGGSLMVSSAAPLYRQLKKNRNSTPIVTVCISAIVVFFIVYFTLAKSNQLGTQVETPAKVGKIAAAKRWVRLADEIASELPAVEASLSFPIIGHDVPQELRERLWMQNSENLSRTLGGSMRRMNQKYQGRIGEAALEMKNYGVTIEVRHGMLNLPPVNTIGWNDWAVELGTQGRHILTMYGVQD